MVTAVVLATYNEAQNLPRLVEALQRPGEELHIYVVDDNSPDGTAAVAQQMDERYGNITVITRPSKEGLGSALKRGMQQALADDVQFLVVMDADLSHDPADVPRLLQVVREGRADMAQGSRFARGGRITGYGKRRRWMSLGVNRAYHYLLGTPLEATTNFRAYTRDAASMVAQRCRSRGFAFQPESTLMVLRHGMRIHEVPITFTDRSLGKSKLDISQTLSGLVFLLTTLVTFRLRVGRFRR